MKTKEILIGKLEALQKIILSTDPLTRTAKVHELFRSELPDSSVVIVNTLLRILDSNLTTLPKFLLLNHMSIDQLAETILEFSLLNTELASIPANQLPPEVQNMFLRTYFSDKLEEILSFLLSNDILNAQRRLGSVFLTFYPLISQREVN